MVFKSIPDRDAFRIYAPKLQPYQQHEAGIRLSLPDHLIPVFKVPEHEGYRIVRRMPGTRRSIKFDDRTRSLALDVKLPDAAWVRITPDQIAAASKGRRKDHVPEVAEILNIAAQDLPPMPIMPPAWPLPTEGLPVVGEEDHVMEQESAQSQQGSNEMKRRLKICF